MKRIRSLDGLRAISILMVLLSHARKTMPLILRKNYVLFYVANSDIGVKIFFVISGYLITKLLIKEREKTGEVSLKNFYIRRVLRIFPVFYLYIFVILLIKWFFVPDIFSHYSLVFFAATYLWNYMHLFIHMPAGDKGGNIFGHFWTLAMEEQFYLLWPIIFIKTNKDNLIKIVIAIILIMPFLRIATYFFIPGSRGQIGMMLQTGGDTILMGCLGALIENSPYFKERLLKFLGNKFLIYFVILYLFFISTLITAHLHGAYDLLIGRSIDNIFIITLVFWCVYIPSTLSSVLNSKIFIQIGILSYSLYIWQQLFFRSGIDFWIFKFPANLIVVFLIGFLSYYLIEKPILSLKNRFKIHKSPIVGNPV
jgi:peptidoglycan/LPS O-acetylase OafA/YrhL